jgi:hypothetical protein
MIMNEDYARGLKERALLEEPDYEIDDDTDDTDDDDCEDDVFVRIVMLRIAS